MMAQSSGILVFAPEDKQRQLRFQTSTVVSHLQCLMCTRYCSCSRARRSLMSKVPAHALRRLLFPSRHDTRHTTHDTRHTTHDTRNSCVSSEESSSQKAREGCGCPNLLCGVFFDIDSYSLLEFFSVHMLTKNKDWKLVDMATVP